MLKIKQIFYILTLICLTGFFILPNIALANDLENIDLKEYGKYLELPSRNAESLLHSLINLFHSEWINLMASGYSSDEERAVPSIMKKVVQVQALNHLLIDAPIEITWAIIKNGTNVAKIFLTKDPSAILKEFEKQSVKKAVAFGMSVLLEQEIKLTPGAMDFQYISQKQEKKIASFQYIIAYKPVNFEKGEVLIRFYSPKPLEPPDNKGSIGMYKGIYTDLKHDLPPFIVDIHGFLKDYKWASNPSIKITFPEQVPDLGIRPLTWWQKYVLKPITSTIKNVEIIVTKITGISLGLTDAWHSIKSLVSGIFDFISPAGITTSFPSTETIEKEQRQEQESLFFSSLNSDQDQKQESSEEKTLSLEKNIPLTKPVPTPSLDDLQKTLDEIAKQIEMLAQKLNEFEAENKTKELKETETCSVNINTASQQELEKLTGIGPVLAERIIETRPFNSIYGLINVKGIGDSVLGKIIDQNCAYVDQEIEEFKEKDETKTESTESTVCHVNINTASQQDLDKIIGIGPVLAQRIMAARPFNSVYELIKVNGIGEVTLDKIINQNCAYVSSSFFGGSSSVPVSNPNPDPNPDPDPDPIFPPEETGSLEVVINEIAWPGTKNNSIHQWIELYNNTDKEINLTDWQLVWNNNKKKILLSSKISAQDYFVIAYGCININIASQQDLEKITGIGPVLAQRIIAARPFSSLNDLIQVSGIGEVTLQKIIDQGLACLEETDNFSEMEIDLFFQENLDNKGLVLELFDSEDNLIDKIGCFKDENQNCLNWFAGDNQTKQTMERINSNSSGLDSNNWANNNLITRNGLDRDGEPINGTPGQENSVSKSETIVNFQNFNSLFEEFNEISFTYYGNPYIVNGLLDIPENKILVIEPGTMIKFSAGRGLTINGTLLAIGTDQEKIILTSIYDPDYGGEEEDYFWGKYWKKIHFTSSSMNSKMENLLIRYGGKVLYQETSAVVWVNESSIEFRNSTFEEIDGNGLHLDNSSSTVENLLFQNITYGGSIKINGGAPLIKNCKFITVGPIYIEEKSQAQIIDNYFKDIQFPQGVIFVKDSTPVFKGNSGENNLLNGIYVFGEIDRDWHLFQNDEHFPYIVGQLNILASTTLTIDAGLVIKFIEFGKISVNGTLKAIGQEDKKIIFTSAADEQYGGKTDNAFIGPDLYHWDQIYFSPSSENSILEHAVFRYAANPHTLGFHFSDGAVCLENSPTTQIIDCHFENMEKGIRIEESCPQIERVSFSNVDCLYDRGTVCYDFYDEICLI